MSWRRPHLVPRAIVPLTRGQKERLWANPKIGIFDWLLKNDIIFCYFTGCYSAPASESSLREKLTSVAEIHEPKAIDHCKCCKRIDSVSKILHIWSPWVGVSISTIGFAPQHSSSPSHFWNVISFIQSNGISMTLIDLSLVCTKFSWIMAEACSLSEEESDSNESFGLSSSEGFSSSSSDSSEDILRIQLGKPTT